MPGKLKGSSLYSTTPASWGRVRVGARSRRNAPTTLVILFILRIFNFVI